MSNVNSIVNDRMCRDVGAGERMDESLGIPAVTTTAKEAEADSDNKSQCTVVVARRGPPQVELISDSSSVGSRRSGRAGRTGWRGGMQSSTPGDCRVLIQGLVTDGDTTRQDDKCGQGRGGCLVFSRDVQESRDRKSVV